MTRCDAPDPHAPAGTVEPLPGGAAWRARDDAGRLLGVYPSEAAARSALADAAAGRPGEAPTDCASAPCLGCFD